MLRRLAHLLMLLRGGVKMLASFLSSRLSGYIAIISVVLIIGAIYYIYNEGKSACVSAVNSKTLKIVHESQKNASAVKIEEQGLVLSEIDKGLCELRVVRGLVGCEF